LIQKKAKLIPLICFVFIAIVLSVMAAGVLSDNKNNPVSVDVSGRISSSDDIAVYSDPQATIACSNVDCGKISKDSTSNQIIYIKNIGNVSETLKMITVNCDPLFARSPLTVTWSQDGTILEPGSIVPATLNLKMGSNAGSFSNIIFNVVIAGTV
jgi:archaellum component FlaG (FlaF/FlaG flagellin family)